MSLTVGTISGMLAYIGSIMLTLWHALFVGLFSNKKTQQELQIEKTNKDIIRVGVKLIRLVYW